MASGLMERSEPTSSRKMGSTLSTPICIWVTRPTSDYGVGAQILHLLESKNASYDQQP